MPVARATVVKCDQEQPSWHAWAMRISKCEMACQWLLAMCLCKLDGSRDEGDFVRARGNANGLGRINYGHPSNYSYI